MESSKDITAALKARLLLDSAQTDSVATENSEAVISSTEDESEEVVFHFTEESTDPLQKIMPLPEEKPEPFPDLEKAHPTEDTSASHSESQQRKNLLALFSAVWLLYFVMFYCWQKMADQYGDKFWEDEENENKFAKYVKFCLSTGAAELGAGFTANLALTYFESMRRLTGMKRWGGWDGASAFLTGTLWQLYSDLGKFVGGGFSMIGNPYSWSRILVSLTTIFCGNFFTLAGVDKLKQSNRITSCLSFFGSKLKQGFTCGRKKHEGSAELPKEMTATDTSPVADSVGNAGFFGMAPLDLGSFSPPGDRTAFPSAVISAVLTAGAQVGIEKYRSSRR